MLCLSESCLIHGCPYKHFCCFVVHQKDMVIIVPVVVGHFRYFLGKSSSGSDAEGTDEIPSISVQDSEKRNYVNSS